MSRRITPTSTVKTSRLLARMPTAAWICALVAFLNAACWSLITPPFQTPDEPSHYAYVEHLAQTGSLPTAGEESDSPAVQVALYDLRYAGVRYIPGGHTIFSQAAQRQLEHDLALPLSREDHGVGFAASEPPLYYALQLIPYNIESGGTVLDRLALMRLLSALMGAITALFAFLFIREALPGTPWAWTVGGLCVAFTPVLGFISGAVNPDALLAAVSAALFYCLARGFRRGLTPRLAIAIGAVIAVGFVTKLNFVGLLPGAALGLLALTVRAARTSKRAALRSLTLTLAVAASPICLYAIANLLSSRSTLGPLSSGVTIVGQHGPLNEISYIWQYYLPRLPGMHAYFPGLSTTRQLWIKNLVGVYGWLDTTFPTWVYNAALIPIGLLGLLVTRELFVKRDSLRHRAGELTVYATIAVGVLIMLGVNDYLVSPAETGQYVQFRYMLPLIALFGALLALAARGAGRRWGPVAGALIVALLIAHNTFSQLLEISRYYYG
jgi:4-amino-4-deoxy-L-arabinose transferase-like glycosyltransferase